jgi:hypothetical protein
MSTSAAASSVAPDQSARLADLARATGLRVARDLAPPDAVPRPRPAPRGDETTLPVHPDLAHVLPAGGLRRGSVVSVRGSHTLLWMLLAEATRAGSWAALVGLPDLGLLAGLDLGIPPDRLLLVPDPGPDLSTVLAALLDGVDLIAVNINSTTSHRRSDHPDRGNRHRHNGTQSAPQRRIDTALARSLANRARHRGGIILTTGSWPGADLDICADGNEWTGLDHGAGYLTGQHLQVTVTGRGSATRPRTGQITLHQPTPTTAESARAALSIVSPA